MIFYALSSISNECLERFFAHYRDIEDHQSLKLIEKVESCCYRVYLIAGDRLVEFGFLPETIDKITLVEISHAWVSICDAKDTSNSEIDKYWQVIDQIGDSISFDQKTVNKYIRRFRQSADEEIFFILLTGAEPSGLPAYELLLLSNIWQFKHGFFPLHASGIQHHGYLYLFSGSSGAGKSTVSVLSKDVGDQIIDQDQVLIYLLPGGDYAANGWGYGITPCDSPIKAIFNLVKDSEDGLIPLKQMQVAQFVFHRHNDILSDMLDENLLRESFHHASDIARQVPGFELHFRKSPDFWKLIDAQFPD